MKPRISLAWSVVAFTVVILVVANLGTTFKLRRELRKKGESVPYGSFFLIKRNDRTHAIVMRPDGSGAEYDRYMVTSRETLPKGRYTMGHVSIIDRGKVEKYGEIKVADTLSLTWQPDVPGRYWVTPSVDCQIYSLHFSTAEECDDILDASLWRPLQR